MVPPRYPAVMTDLLTADARTEILNVEVARYVSKGWSVQSQAGGQAVLSKTKRIGVFWNVLLSLLTGGLWLIVVAVRVINRKRNSLVLSVNTSGQVTRR
jgi:hypothetical protein